MWFQPFVLISFTLWAVTVWPATEDRYLSYTGSATARQNAKFLYSERHVLRYQQGQLAERVVLYSCEDGTPFARKTVSYADPFAPDFLLEDVSNGLRQGVRSNASGRTVFFRIAAQDSEKTATLPPAAGLVIDAGFDEFVRANWQRLMASQKLPIHFLVPSRLRAMDFQVQRLRHDTADGTPTELFRLKLAGIGGWVLPGIDVSYSADDHVLMRYLGYSDLRDASGDNFRAAITFHAKDRRPSNEELMQSAQRARLAPCR